jgi:hypothetical protein
LAADKFFQVQRIMQQQRLQERKDREAVNEMKKQRVLEKRSLVSFVSDTVV